MSDKIVEGEDVLVFVRRKPFYVEGEKKYPIAGMMRYKRVSRHSEFLKIQMTYEQSTLIKNRSCDLLLFDVLSADYPDSDFLKAEKDASVEDVRGLGLTISKYIQIVEPVLEVEE